MKVMLSNKILSKKHKNHTRNYHIDKDFWIRIQLRNISLMTQLDVILYKNAFNETY